MNLTKYSVSILLFIILSAVTAFCRQETSETLNLMPVPEEITMKQGEFRLEEAFTIGVSGNAGDRLYNAAVRALRRLSGRTGLFFTQDYITGNENTASPDLMIECRRIGDVKLHEDESYKLSVTENGIRLESETDIGALRGLETFLQLLDADADGYFFPAVDINDSPRFVWRGLLIDVGRHFMPVDVIKRNLDAMAAVKLNVLHWHLSEDQGFRIESKTYPKLHQMGSDGFYYTQEQIKDIIQYADDRGIRIMPEFDMPGHVTSWLVGYPELASAPGPYEIGRRWGVMDPAMDPTKNSTYNFLDRFFKEMTALFPDDYFHIGGDENNGKHWDANADIQRFKERNDITDNHALQSYFNKKILGILTKYNKKMVGWDEIFQPDLPTNIFIQSWRGKQALVEAAKRGYQSILSNGYYIDLIRPTDHHYLNDPLPEDSELNEDEKKFILGGEATMWAEYISYETIDSRAWPRTAAIAERFWSPGYVKDLDDMYRRLQKIDLQLEEHGLLHNKNYEMFLRR
ncbi:MAG: family 20 glycosylhydrolase, partial [bacterium]|nr:family 20 glycosylhydrolase [bacterium]